MVDVLIAMKVRALRRTLHGWMGTAYVITAVVGLCIALVCVAFMALHPGGIPVGVDLAATVFAVWTLGWLFGPIMGASDETLRPENFALLPLRPSALASGLLGASLVGVAPLVTAVIMVGLVLVAIPAGIGAVLVALLGAAGQLALAVLLSRVVFAGLGAALASRRGRDLGVVLGAVVGLAYLPVIMLLPYLEPLVVERTSPLFTAVLHGLPTGWGPAAVAAAAEGRWVAALGLLAALGVLDALLVLAWSRLLVRRLTAAQPTARAQAAGARRSARTVLPDSPLGAVIGKELLLWWRDTRRKALLFSSILIGILLPVFYTWQNSSLVPLASAGLWVVAFASLQCGNVYGMDGSAVWQTLVAPDAARVDVRGRQLAWLLIVGPVALLAAAVLPAATGTADSYPWQLALVTALLGAGSGTFVLASVRAPVPMPSLKGGSPFATGPGGAAGKIVNAFAMLGRQVLAVLLPLAVLVAGAITGWAALDWAAVPLGVVCGVWAAWRWGGKAARQVADRGPELLAAVRLPV